ncbi:MAG: zinc-binding dehydrogenase [Desulfurococcales archaeon]|nr:zinc-binding dehydrogenase [Desulfurococcales archaeon]
MNETMRAAVLKEYLSPLSIEEVPRPRVKGPNEVVVKIAGSGVCHTDVHVWRGEAEAVLDIKLPLILGHEPSGIVYEVGEGVPERLRPGTPVLVCASSFCGEEDEYTLTGDTQLCDKPEWPGLSWRQGAYAEYLHVPHYKYLIPASELDDLEAASLLTDAGVTAYRAVKKAADRVKPDDYVAIVGLGGVGLFALQLAKNYLHSNVIGVDVSDEKLDFAARIVKPGPQDHLINARKTSNLEDEILKATGGKGVKAVLDFVGLESEMEVYLRVLAKKGIYVVVGLGSPFGSQVPSLHLILGERSITGVLWGSCNDVRELSLLAKKGVVDYSSIVTARIRLDDVNEALEKLDRGEVLGRQVIVFK